MPRWCGDISRGHVAGSWRGVLLHQKIQIQAIDLRPYGKVIAVDLGFGTANSKKPLVLVIGDAQFVLKIFVNKSRTNAVVLLLNSSVLLSANTEIGRLDCQSLFVFLLRVQSMVVQVLCRLALDFTPIFQNLRISVVVRSLSLLFFLHQEEPG